MRGPALWWKKVRFRVLLFGLVMSIVPFLLLGIWNAKSSKEQLLHELDLNNQLQLEHAAQALKLELERISQQLSTLTRSHPPTSWQEDYQLAFIMTQIPQIERITYLDQAGYALITLDRWEMTRRPERFSPLTAEVWQELEQGSIYYGEVQMNRYQKPLLPIAVPLLAPDQSVVGAILTEVQIRQLLEQVSVPVPGINSALFLLDQEGQLLAHRDHTTFLYENVTTENRYAHRLQEAEALHGGNLYKGSYISMGTEYVTYYRKIPHFDWVVGVEQPLKAEMEAVERLQFSLASSAILIALFVAALSFFFANRFSRPIEVLEKGVQRVTAGDYTYQIAGIEQRDEIGRLVDSFNQMTVRLRQQNESLQAEKRRLDQVVSGLGLGLILFDEKRNIVWVNKTIQAWFGAAEQLIGLHCHQLLGSNCPFSSFCYQYPAVEDGEGEGWQEEITSVQQIQGKKRIISHRLFQLEGHTQQNEGDSVPVLEVLEDITERKEMEMMVRQADKLSAVGLLASGVAHEINNPLNTLALYTDDLLDRIEAEDVESLKQAGELSYYLQTMQKQIDRCTEITTSLLHFSRKGGDVQEEFPLLALLQEVLLLLRYALKKKEIDLQLECTGDEYVAGNRSEVQQVLHNLLSNAIDAVAHGGRITIGCQQAKEWIQLTISDNGCGIPRAELPLLFDPFYSTKPVGEGTGLGMYIAYGIMERMGGSIQVESEEGVGTEVRLFFPRIALEGGMDE